MAGMMTFADGSTEDVLTYDDFAFYVGKYMGREAKDYVDDMAARLVDYEDIKAQLGYLEEDLFPNDDKSAYIDKDIIKPFVQFCVNELGDYDSKIDLKQKCIYLQQLVSVTQIIWGNDDKYSQELMWCLAQAYDKCGRYDEAFSIYVSIYLIRVCMLGGDNVETLNILRDIGQSHVYLGNNERAKEIFDYVSGKFEELLGNDNELIKDLEDRFEKLRAEGNS